MIADETLEEWSAQDTMHIGYVRTSMALTSHSST